MFHSIYPKSKNRYDLFLCFLLIEQIGNIGMNRTFQGLILSGFQLILNVRRFNRTKRLLHRFLDSRKIPVEIL